MIIDTRMTIEYVRIAEDRVRNETTTLENETKESS